MTLYSAPDALAGRDFRVRVGRILAAASDGRVSVLVDDMAVNLHHVRDYSPTVGDECLVMLRGGQGYVLGALGAAPRALGSDTGTEPPPTSAEAGTAVFRPVETDTYRDGVGWLQTSDMTSGDPNGRGNMLGAAYFGDAPQGLQGLSVVSCSITMTRLSGGWPERSPTIRLLSENRKPGGFPGIIDVVWLPWLLPGFEPLRIGGTVTYPLHESWGTQLLSGEAGGLAIYGAANFNDYIRLDGPRTALRIDWRR